MREPGIDPPERVLRARVAFGAVWHLLVPLFVAILGVPAALALAPATPWIILALAATMLVAIAALVATHMADVTVGSDGILIRRFGERRYFRFADLASVAEIDGEKLRLELRDGRPYDLYTHKDQNIGKEGYQELCEALHARIREGIAAHRDDDGAPRAEGIVARAAPQRASGYRAAQPASAEELWGVVGDASAAPELRARAAAALRRDATEDARPRLLRVADDTAEPTLARALRIAADAEAETAEAEVEAALAEASAAVGAREER